MNEFMTDYSRTIEAIDSIEIEENQIDTDELILLFGESMPIEFIE